MSYYQKINPETKFAALVSTDLQSHQVGLEVGG